MTVPANLYLKTAFEFEAKARNATDPWTKSTYEDLAIAYRDVATLSGQSPKTSDEELDVMAERMVNEGKKNFPIAP
jgi:hypothetical protein